jgi:hypothetical protein
VAQDIDWSDVEDAAKKLAGNWSKFDCFAWMRGYGLADPDRWMIWYTSHPGEGLTALSNEATINKELEPFGQGEDPDLVFEQHSHWLVGHVKGFSIRVYRDGHVTEAFRKFCSLMEELEDNPVLDQLDYSDREYDETLKNYGLELWPDGRDLPEGWAGQVYEWFSDHGQDECIENRDDQGGWAPKEKIVEALQDLGLWPAVVVERQKRGDKP